LQQHSVPPEPFPHNEASQARKLGPCTSTICAIPTLAAPHTACEKGKVSTPGQAQLLKLIGVRMVRFKVGLRVKGEASSEEIIEVQGQEIANDTEGGEGGGGAKVGQEMEEYLWIIHSFHLDRICVECLPLRQS